MTRASKPPTSGKGTLKLLLTNLTIPFGGITMVQVLSTEALVRYEWEAPSAATQDEPPDYGSFDIVSIRLQDQMVLVDDQSIANVKLWKNSEMCEVLSEDQIKAFETHCEALVRSGKAVNYIITKKTGPTHKLNWYSKKGNEEKARARGYSENVIYKEEE